MKKLIPFILALTLTACAHQRYTSHEVVQPLPQDKKAVVICSVEIKRAQTELDNAQVGLELEKQNAMLRTTIAQLKAYILDLEAGLVQCGGKVN